MSQQFAGVYSAVFQTWPPSSPGQAGGPVYLLGSVMLQARLHAEKRERIITLLSPLLVTSTMRARLRTKNSFSLLWLRTNWVLNGPRGGSSSGMTMEWWWLFCLLVPLEILPLMVPMHFLALLAVRHSFPFKASSVHAKANPVADTLSRFQFQRFRHLAPQAKNADAPPISGSPHSPTCRRTD